MANIPDEFYRDTDKLKTGIRFTDETAARVIVSEEGERIVGIWVVSAQVHSGPIWVDRTRRGNSTEMRQEMWTRVARTINEIGARGALMIAMDDVPSIEHIIEGIGGQKIPGTLYQIEV